MIMLEALRSIKREIILAKLLVLVGF